jgi:hypothetical protein
MSLIMNDQTARTNADTAATEPIETHDSFKKLQFSVLKTA